MCYKTDKIFKKEKKSTFEKNIEKNKIDIAKCDSWDSNLQPPA